jgi:uncharacterized LabA/DUF88 family protein
VRNETGLLTDRQWMLFVDGENFTKRGQEVLKDAKVSPLAGTHWQKDVYLWVPFHTATDPFMGHQAWSMRRIDEPYSPPPPSAHAATRSYYYTSMPYENAGAVTHTRLALRELGFEPRMFPRRQGKSKAVDLSLATDVLTLAGENRYEVAVIFAGDGDYVPVVEAVKRLGRHVVVGFFGGVGAGLNDELRIAADDFVDLTGPIIRNWKMLHETVERERLIAANKAADSSETPQ